MLTTIAAAVVDITRTRYYTSSMSLYKTRPFSRLAKKVGISDSALKAAIKEMREGIIQTAVERGILEVLYDDEAQK
jgi:histone H3/H4